MHAFTTYAGISGQLLMSDVQIRPAYDPKSQQLPPPFTTCVAVWNTASTITAITRTLAQHCGLDATPLTGTPDIARHVINLKLPNNVELIALSVVSIANLPIEGKRAQMLIGMDVIGGGDFAISNYGGGTMFTFRSPSQGSIDFLPPEARQQPVATVGRNDPCPCGSGKKYKKCHGQRQQTTTATERGDPN